MTKRFIDYIVADYELPTPLFNKTISPHVLTKQMSAQLEVHTHVMRALSSKCNAIATLFDCSNCSKKDFANQQALAQDIKVRKDIKNS